MSSSILTFCQIVFFFFFRFKANLLKLPNLRFSDEPPSSMEFLNTKGATIACTAAGDPQPIISWKLVDGSNVTNVSKLRHVTFDGKLVFHSFRPEGFRPDIHSTVYRCIASSSVGVIRSLDVVVKGGK